MLVFHVDLNFVSLRQPYLDEWLARLAGMGYTAILWELEDKVRWETCPECVDAEAMPKSAFAGILARSRALGLENIPLLQTIGHAEYVLKHPHYRPWREDPAFHDCYCVCNAEVRAFLVSWIEEYRELFGDLRQFHLGGDEAYRFASCPTCRRRAGEIGRNGLYAEHVAALAAGLLRRGITPGVWGDMILAEPDRIDELPPEIRIWDWNYWDGVDSPDETRVWGHGRVRVDQVDPSTARAVPDLLDAKDRLVPFHSSRLLKRSGRDAVVCGASRSSGDSFFFGRHEVHGPNVVGAVQTARESGLSGACVTSWAIRVHPWETQLPWISMAARAWHEPGLDYAANEAREAESGLGVDRETFLRLQRGLGVTFPFARGRESGIQFDGLKDPVPAPPGYVRTLLRDWAGEGRVPALLDEIAENLGRLDESTAIVRTLVRRGRSGAADGCDAPGLRILDAYLQAAHLQLRAALIAREILSATDGGSVTSELAPVISSTQRAMAAWAHNWMTSGSALLVSRLLYDPILDSCRPAAGS